LHFAFIIISLKLLGSCKSLVVVVLVSVADKARSSGFWVQYNIVTLPPCFMSTSQQTVLYTAQR